VRRAAMRVAFFAERVLAIKNSLPSVGGIN
jgi:hypothetical protein